MKTNQLILIAAAVTALTACTKETLGNQPEINSDQVEIGFNAVNLKATKANNAIITGTVYDTTNTFQVWGWQSPAADFSEFADDAASNFMSNLKISWNGGPQSRANAWRNADHYYYWPFTGKIGFLAIHPSTVAPTSTGWDATNDKAKATIDDYTVVGKDSTDLMFAYNAGSRRADALPMVFKHALSQIQVRVRTNDDYSADVTFKIDSLGFNNIDLSGDLAYANEDFAWTDNEAQTEKKQYFSDTMTVNYKATDAAADLYGRALVMIPQAKFADDPATTEVLEGTTITLKYTMKQNGSDPITGVITVPAGQEWLAGKRYLYTLNFKLNEILFDPTVTDWVDVEVATINILD